MLIMSRELIKLKKYNTIKNYTNKNKIVHYYKVSNDYTTLNVVIYTVGILPVHFQREIIL